MTCWEKLNKIKIFWQNAIPRKRGKKWDLICRAVLEYYDKCYEYEKIGKKNIKKLDLTNLQYDKKIIELINNVL